ncbi:peptide chain release factor N(5)-glutamine methyltransferase [Desulfolithobacter sp.]
MRLFTLYQDAIRLLQQDPDIENAELDARLLVQHVTGFGRTELFLHGDRPVGREETDRLQRLLHRRLRREPLQYILGSCEFWTRTFLVSPAVLIPRPETEFFLEHVLSTLRKDPVAGPVVDLCTGSGVIAVILALELGLPVTGVDISLDALEIADRNVRLHGLDDRVSLVGGDLLSWCRPGAGLGCIVSNPPYIKADDIRTLQPEVRDWEPLLALSGGERGLDIIERIIRDSAGLLLPGGWLFMEIGADQGGSVVELVAATAPGAFAEVRVLTDWAGRPRVLQARKTKNMTGNG